MEDWLLSVERCLNDSPNLDARLDVIQEACLKFGFTGINYDYSPVSRGPDGRVLTPVLLKLRGIPDSMFDLWCNKGYYQIDPVVQVSNSRGVPFAWSYLEKCESAISRIMNPRSKPVVSYLHDTRLTVGVTVPMRLSRGELATFTGIRFDPGRDYFGHIQSQIGEIGLLAYMFHNIVAPGLEGPDHVGQHVCLTARERQCLQLCAQGLTAKQIAYRLDRAIGTVTLHLNTAARKLSARNRAQAVARAVHLRLIEGNC
jgi:LuxR family transcriptional regulator, quorum-sensing system regulator SdiA